MDGVIVVDKPEGWTSHDVVGKFRGMARIKRVGHLGTLDPMATGVLPLVVGQATRLARFYTRAEKTYEAIVRFGFATDTYDRTGTPVGEPCTVSLTRETVEAVLPRFRGKIQQTPPQFSAKKVAGVPAYESARKQVPVELAPVEVEIHELTMLHMEGAELCLRVRCSGGTYIRTIADDLGKALGCGAHLTALRRTSSSEFHVSQAYTLEALQHLVQERRLIEALHPISAMLPEFPPAVVDEAIVISIRQGRDFQVKFTDRTHEPRWIRAFAQDGTAVAIAEAVLPHWYHPAIVFATA